MACVLFGVLTHSGLWSVRAGMISGAFCWFGFVLTTMTVNNAFHGRRPMLTVIDSGHWLGAADHRRHRRRMGKSNPVAPRSLIPRPKWNRRALSLVGGAVA